MRIKLIACQVFTRELCAAIAVSPNEVDVSWLPKGLHSAGSETMRDRIQWQIDGVAARDHDAIALGYGLCNNGLVGVHARELPLVLPRAHDCITLFMGHRERYRRYFERHIGTYFLTSGWIERSRNGRDLDQLSIEKRHGLDLDHAQLVARYGADNAAYLAEALGQARHYGRYAFIEMGVEPDDRFLEESRRRAAERDWEHQHLQGDMSLIHRLLDGPWYDDFLVVEPGQRVRASWDEDIVASETAVEA